MLNWFLSWGAAKEIEKEVKKKKENCLFGNYKKLIRNSSQWSANQVDCNEAGPLTLIVITLRIFFCIKNCKQSVHPCAVKIRHLVKWNTYLDDWNEAGDTFETEARVPLLPNDTSTGDNRSSTFRPLLVSMTFRWSVVSMTFWRSVVSMTIWWSVAWTTCRPLVSMTFGSFIRTSSGRRLRFRNIRTRFLMSDRSAKLPFSGRTIRIDFRFRIDQSGTTLHRHHRSLIWRMKIWHWKIKK